MANDMSPAPMGHNGGPEINPAEVAAAPFAAYIDEADNWLDGTPLASVDQMRAVEDVVKNLKRGKKAVEDERESVTKPLHTAWQNGIALFKPTLTGFDNRIKGLLALIEPIKKAEAAQKAEEDRQKREAAWRAQDEARKAAAAAAQNITSIDAQTAAEAAMRQAEEAQRAAREAAAQKEKGLRTVQCHAVRDRRGIFDFIKENCREDLDAFIDEWAAKNFRKYRDVPGLEVWEEKRAF